MHLSFVVILLATCILELYQVCSHITLRNAGCIKWGIMVTFLCIKLILIINKNKSSPVNDANPVKFFLVASRL